MDLQMPIMNGFEATDYSRNTLHLEIPIIALTADVTTVDLAKCKAVGMDDYIAKPVDERILYSKIVKLVKEPLRIESSDAVEVGINLPKRPSCIDMSYLIHHTKSNSVLMMEMIALYLKQTPPLIHAMKESLNNRDWSSLYSAVHKMIPSFSLMGINVDFENMARKVQAYGSSQQDGPDIPGLVLELERICGQACSELEEEFNRIKNAEL